ncbi:hypothetical protein FB567DRAFT_612413 [Paraphoma chrysanthemicola]|uniref:Uncharacterized protein n=1 Tax=Paraphoma chrysanthemicola TaxID=798071 RepID=A0A8K0VST6_9PLEO|nr:hypothetical protein FB567DRAFT_612413 [Paraphoma chrysanthemicola]
MPRLVLNTAFWDDDTASDAEFEKFALKGGALMCALGGTDKTAGRLLRDTRDPPSAASIWTGNLRQELHEWYWRESNPRSYACQFNGHWQFADTLRALGLNSKSTVDGGDNACYKIEHWDSSKQENGKQVPVINQWYRADNTDFRATGGHYEFGMNTKGGAIFGLFLESPKTGASSNWYGNSKDPDPTLLPRLRSLSDVLWGFWNRDNPNIKNIRYFFMLGISNEATNQVIASCLQKANKELCEWPGTEFKTDTDQGHAILGTPNGAVFAYFLLQHKAQLGYKTITKVTVIRPESDDENDFVDASLIFHVEDAPEPPADDESGSTKIKRQDNRTVEVVHSDKNSVIRIYRFGA